MGRPFFVIARSPLEEKRVAYKDLRHLRPAVHLAQKMGPLLERCEVLLRAMPPQQAVGRFTPLSHRAALF